MVLSVFNTNTITPPQPKARELYFQKQVNQDTVAALSKDLLEIDKHDQYLKKLYSCHGQEYKAEPIQLYIDSYGGSVYQCFGLLGIMEQSKTPITTIVTGVAMSAGFMIAISGHHRKAYKHATFMYHQLSSAAWGTMADLIQQVEEAQRLQNKIHAIVTAKTKITLPLLEDNFNRKLDWFMDVNIAKEYGCLDEVIDNG